MNLLLGLGLGLQIVHGVRLYLCGKQSLRRSIERLAMSFFFRAVLRRVAPLQRFNWRRRICHPRDSLLLLGVCGPVLLVDVSDWRQWIAGRVGAGRVGGSSEFVKLLLDERLLLLQGRPLLVEFLLAISAQGIAVVVLPSMFGTSKDSLAMRHGHKRRLHRGVGSSAPRVDRLGVAVIRHGSRCLTLSLPSRTRRFACGADSESGRKRKSSRSIDR